MACPETVTEPLHSNHSLNNHVCIEETQFYSRLFLYSTFIRFLDICVQLTYLKVV